MRIKKKNIVTVLISFFVFTIFLNNAISQLVGSFIGFMDEIFLGITVLIMIVHIFRHGDKSKSSSLNFFSYTLLSYCVIFILLTLFFGELSIDSVGGGGLVFLSAFVSVKLFFYLWFFFYLYEKEIYTVSSRFIFTLIIVTYSGFVFNYFFEGSFNSVFEYRIVERFGVQRAVGFHMSTVSGAVFLSLLLFFSLYEVKQKTIFTTFCVASIYSVSMIFIYAITTTRSAVIISLIGLLYLVNKRVESAIFSWLIMVSMLFYFFISNNTFMIDSEAVSKAFVQAESILIEPDFDISRSVMFHFGVNSAIDNFPFGYGLSSYASPYAQHSSIYEDIGISLLPFMIEYNGVIDSNISSILGEIGFLGLAFICYLLFLSAKYVKNNSNSQNHNLVTILVLIIALNSLIAPVFFKGDWCITLAILFSMILNKNEKYYS